MSVTTRTFHTPENAAIQITSVRDGKHSRAVVSIPPIGSQGKCILTLTLADVKMFSRMLAEAHADMKE